MKRTLILAVLVAIATAAVAEPIQVVVTRSIVELAIYEGDTIIIKNTAEAYGLELIEERTRFINGDGKTYVSYGAITYDDDDRFLIVDDKVIETNTAKSLVYKYHNGIVRTHSVMYESAEEILSMVQ